MELVWDKNKPTGTVRAFNTSAVCVQVPPPTQSKPDSFMPTTPGSRSGPAGLAEIDAVERCCRFDVWKSSHPKRVGEAKQSGDGGDEQGELE